MLRQDSIQSAELKKKESPFRAKCHEIFCCPLKQVHHKEHTEPEGLCTTDACLACFPSFFFLSLSFWLCIALWCAVCCAAPDIVPRPRKLASECLMQPQMGRCIIQSALARRTAYSCFSQLKRVQLVSWHCPVLAAKVACTRSRVWPITSPSWSSTRLRNGPSKMKSWDDGSKFSPSSPLHKAFCLCSKYAHGLLSWLKQAQIPLSCTPGALCRSEMHASRKRWVVCFSLQLKYRFGKLYLLVLKLRSIRYSSQSILQMYLKSSSSLQKVYAFIFLPPFWHISNRISFHITKCGKLFAICVCFDFQNDSGEYTVYAN